MRIQSDCVQNRAPHHSACARREGMLLARTPLRAWLARHAFPRALPRTGSCTAMTARCSSALNAAAPCTRQRVTPLPLACRVPLQLQLQRQQQRRRPLPWSRAAAASEAAAVAPAAQSAAADEQATETVVLDVGGMKCGGCSAAVKSMLLKQPGVVGAAVNLLTETAAVTVRCGAAQIVLLLPLPLLLHSAPLLSPPPYCGMMCFRQLPPLHPLTRAAHCSAGDVAAVNAAAAFVSSKGFPAEPRAPEAPGGGGALFGGAEAEERRAAEARAASLNLAVAWGLVLLCCSHHFGHLAHAVGLHGVAHGPLMTALGSPPVAGALGAFALLGPGRGCGKHHVVYACMRACMCVCALIDWSWLAGWRVTWPAPLCLHMYCYCLVCWPALDCPC